MTLAGKRACDDHEIASLAGDDTDADFNYLQSHMAQLPNPPSASSRTGTQVEGPVFSSLGIAAPLENNQWASGLHKQSFVAFDPILQLLEIPQFEDQFGLGVVEQTVLEYFADLNLDEIEAALDALDYLRVFKFESVEEKIQEYLRKLEEKVTNSNKCEANQ